MDQGRDELLYSSVKGKNPFKDVRVRRALYQAIDIETLKTKLMNGQSFPTGAVMPSPLGTYNDPALEQRYPFDLAAARKALADAGYPDGFEVQLHCPNNRYVNDEQICIALAGMWAQIKVKVKVSGEPRATYFPRLEKYDFSMYMLGWGGSVTDAETTLTPVMRNNLGEKGIGFYNYGHVAQRQARRARRAVEHRGRSEEARGAGQGGAARVPGAVHGAAAAPPGDPVGGARERQRRPPRRQLVRGGLGDDRQVTAGALPTARAAMPTISRALRIAAAKRAPIAVRFGVNAVADHPAAGDHHVAPGRGRAAEDERVERSLAARRRAARRRRGSTTSTSARAPATRPQAALAGRRGRRRASALEQPLGASTADAELAARRRRCAGAARRRWPYSSRRSSSRQPRVDLAVGADRERHAGAEPAGQVGEAVAEVGLGARAERRCRRRSPRPRRSPARVAWVACTSCQRASSRPSRTSHSIGRAPVAREAVVDLARSARRRGCGSARRSRRRASPARRSTPALAARSEWIARPASTQRPRRRARMRRAASTRLRAPTSESGAGRRAARRRRSRRARTAPAGASGRCRRRRRRRRAPTTSPAGRRRSLPSRSRAAGSGTRRPACSRRAAARRRAARRSRAAARGVMRRRRAYMRSRHDQKSSLAASRRSAQAGEGALEGVAVRVDEAGQHRAGEDARAVRAARRRRPSTSRPAAVARRRAAATSLAPAAGDPGERRPEQRRRRFSGHRARQSSVVCSSCAQQRLQPREAAASAGATGSAARVSSM